MRTHVIALITLLILFVAGASIRPTNALIASQATGSATEAATENPAGVCLPIVQEALQTTNCHDQVGEFLNPIVTIGAMRFIGLQTHGSHWPGVAPNCGQVGVLSGMP